MGINNKYCERCNSGITIASFVVACFCEHSAYQLNVDNGKVIIQHVTIKEFEISNCIDYIHFIAYKGNDIIQDNIFEYNVDTVNKISFATGIDYNVLKATLKM